MTLEEFAFAPIWGLPKILAFMNLWAPLLGAANSGFFLVRYEDLRHDTHTVLLEVLNYLVGEIDRKIMNEAVEWAKFDRMKKREQQSFAHTGMDMAKMADAGNVRQGVVGGHREEMSPSLVERCDQYISDHLAPYFTEYRPSAHGREARVGPT